MKLSGKVMGKNRCMRLSDPGKIQAFFINAFLAFLTFGIFMYREHGLFTLSYDFNSQIVPFTKVCLDSLHNGGGIWNWSIDLGTNIVSAMSYYRLGSPFFWLFSWCGGENVLYILGWEYVVKYAVTGLISYCYIRRYTKSCKSALIGSILYTFSGFQTINLLFGIFHDAVAFFPLLLLTFEDLVEREQRGAFALTVFLNATVNYYCFIGEVVFLVLYLLIRYLPDDPGRYIRRVKYCFFEGLLGVMMASVLFIPSILATLRSARVSAAIPIENFFSFSRRELLYAISSFLLPAEMMMDRSYVYEEAWSSRSAYLPMIGIVLEGAYLLKRNKKDWLKRLLPVLTILMVIPIGNGIFSLFTTDYCRWFYMPILFMVLASVRVLDALEDYRVGWSALLVLVFMVAWGAASFWWDKNKFALIYDQERFVVLFIMAAVGIVLLLIVRMLPGKVTVKQNILFGTILIYAFMTTAFTCNLYQKFDGKDSTELQQRIEAIAMLQPVEESRYVSYEDNLGMTGGFHGINSFISTISGSIPEFWESLGLEKLIFSPVGPVGTEELLSVRYLISEDTEVAEGLKLLSTFEQGGVCYYLYEKPSCLNIGFTYDSYMLKSDFLELDKEIRAIAMLSTLIVDDEDAEYVEAFLPQADLTVINGLSADNMEQLIALHVDENAEKFHISRDSFQCEINANAEKYAFFSVPYDKGWSAYVNGEEVKILNINGLMGIKVQEGRNEIQFRYFDKVLTVSIVLSIVSFLIWLGYFGRSRGCRERDRA